MARDLSPILDQMRAIKSPAEIAVIDRATRIGGEAIMEAMRSTAPGVAESELDAIARFFFRPPRRPGRGLPRHRRQRAVTRSSRIIAPPTR